MTITQQRCRIVRDVTRFSSGRKEAIFTTESGDVLCVAGIHPQIPGHWLYPEKALSLERAGQIHIALGMAIEWVAGELMEKAA